MSTGPLRGLFAMEGVGLGLLMPFLVPLLDERGLTPAQIGVVLGAAGVACLIAYPLWGAVADGRVGRRRTIALTSAVAAAGGMLVLLAGSDLLVIALAISVATVGALPWGPLIDALALRELDEPAGGYGRVRAWASVGWALAAVGAGAVWLAWGAVPVMVGFSVAAVIVAGMALWPGASGAARSRATLVAEESGARVSARLLPRQLRAASSPVLVGFLAGLFVVSIGEHASARFVSLRILDQGGGVLLVGIAAALPAIVEIPVFGASRALLARLGLRRMYVGGALIAAVLAALVALASEAWIVTVLRTLDGTSYALRYMAMVIIVGALLPGHLHALGQSLTWFVYAGIAPIVADVAGGLVYGSAGAAALFMTSMLAMLAGGGTAWLSLRGPRFAIGASGVDLPVDAAAPTLPPA